LKAGHLLRRAVRHELDHIVQTKPAQCHARPGELSEAFIGHDDPFTHYAVVGGPADPPVARAALTADDKPDPT